MIRGTTPTHEFVLPFPCEMVKTVQIIYAQNDTVILEKENNDCTMNGNVVSVKLTQEDTFGFSEDSCVEVQIRVLTCDEDVLASHVMRVRCDECLYDGVLV